MSPARAALVLGLLVPASAAAALPVPGAAGSPGAADAGSARPSSNGNCEERLAGRKTRPPLAEAVPLNGKSGHVVELSVNIEHDKGETVLPGGFQFGLAEEGTRALERSGFFLPHPDGGAGPTILREPAGERVKTRVVIPFLALPPKPGRQVLTLPPLPITLSRSS